MNKTKSPKLVNTPTTEGSITAISYARTKEGRIDLAAYKGLKGKINANNMMIDVNINDARVRYGHLDLQVSPVAGTGEVWVERKNIEILNDPAGGRATKVSKVGAEKPSNAFPSRDIQEMIRLMIAEERKKNAIQ